MERKAFVLLSGGLDSTTCLYKAIFDFKPSNYTDEDVDLQIDDQLTEGNEPITWVEAVSIDYGQRHLKETQQAKKICQDLGIKHTTINIGQLLSGDNVMLTNPDIVVPDISYAQIQGVSPTYVPFRNGLMLSVLAAHVQKYVNSQIEEEVGSNSAHFQNAMDFNEAQATEYVTAQAKDLCGIYFGAHAEDAHNWAYPDCTPEFIGAMANAIYTGSYYTIRLFAPLQSLKKADIVKLGNDLGVPFENTWSCYKGEDKHCGTCPTCRSRREAFRIAGVEDPTQYSYGEVRQCPKK